MYLKVTTPPCGARMPLTFGGSGQLNRRQLAQLKQWIERGAPDDSIWDSGEAPLEDAGADARPVADASGDQDARVEASDGGDDASGD